MLQRIIVIMCLLVLSQGALAAESSDAMEIRQAALDYIEGWYEGNAQRMERALHPDLVKRMVYTRDSRSQLNHQSGLSLVQGTSGRTRQDGSSKSRKEVTILDQYKNAASVKIVASEWIDYLHVVKWNGSWKIINVLWELNEPPF